VSPAAALGGALPTRTRHARPWGGRRGWVLAGAGAVLVIILLELIGSLTGSGPQGPVSSAYATDAQGLAAWAELAGGAGQPVSELRAPLSTATLDPASTVVVLDPDALLRGDGERLLAFVRAGGRLIVGGQDPDAVLTALSPAPPGWVGTAGTSDGPTPLGASVLPGVGTVASAGAGAWTQTSGDRVLLADADGNPVLLAQRLGAGEILLLADASPLQNAYLATADNAQLALVLGGSPRRPLVFVESVHGYGTSRGLAALPLGFKVALIGLALAGLLWVLARGRRLGPPDALDPLPVPARSAYVRALALLLRRSARPDELAPTLRRAAERELAARPSTVVAATTGAPPERRRALARAGLDDAEIEALSGDAAKPDVLALAAAVAHLRSRP